MTQEGGLMDRRSLFWIFWMTISNQCLSHETLWKYCNSIPKSQIRSHGDSECLRHNLSICLLVVKREKRGVDFHKVKIDHDFSFPATYVTLHNYGGGIMWFIRYYSISSLGKSGRMCQSFTRTEYHHKISTLYKPPMLCVESIPNNQRTCCAFTIDMHSCATLLADWFSV